MRQGTAYLAGAAQAAAALLEPEGLLAPIVVSLVLTAWTGGWGRGTGLEADGEASLPLTSTSHPDEDGHLQGSLPAPTPRSQGPTTVPLCHQKVRTRPSGWGQELRFIQDFLWP